MPDRENEPLKTACLNYESEYHRLRDELSKACTKIECLRKELDRKDSNLAYYEGMKHALEVIFGREFPKCLTE